MKTPKIRLTELIKKQFPGLSTEEILVKILSGQVFVNAEKITDKNLYIKSSSLVEMKSSNSFVSRGGEKLAYILRTWDIAVKDKVWLDAGASTGGFSDCLLRQGAKLIYAVDVGYNQLAYSLRVDKRIVVCERTNIRNITRASFTIQPDAAVCDLSFRSVKGIAGYIISLVSSNTLIALIKPQFEYMNPPADFTGVVKTSSELKAILAGLIIQLEKEGVYVERMDFSPIRGHKGNRELFFLLSGKQTTETGRANAMLERLLDTLDKNNPQTPTDTTG